MILPSQREELLTLIASTVTSRGTSPVTVQIEQKMITITEAPPAVLLTVTQWAAVQKDSIPVLFSVDAGGVRIR